MIHLVASFIALALILLCVSSGIIEEHILEIIEGRRTAGFSIGGLVVALLLTWNIGALVLWCFGALVVIQLYDHGFYWINQHLHQSEYFADWVVLNFPVIIVSFFGLFFIIWDLARNIALRSRLKKAREIASA